MRVQINNNSSVQKQKEGGFARCEYLHVLYGMLGEELFVLLKYSACFVVIVSFKLTGCTGGEGRGDEF